MTRILSALVLVPLVLAAIWLAPAWLFALVIAVVVGVSVAEYANLVEKTGVPVPRTVSTSAAVAASVAVAWPGVPADVVLAACVVAVPLVVLAAGRPAPRVPASAAAAMFPVAFLGVPLGLIGAIRGAYGREVVLLLLVVVWVSDSAQYYLGSWLGRHRLAPAVSPGKSVEGAIGGVVAGITSMVGLGRLWLPAASLAQLAAFGAVLVGLGIAGDLFESLLKRSADVKDSSGLIPGHGGVLDRVDALLFVMPGAFVTLRLIL
ncbi:MAG: phosphatidate cytidylyltransferase [Acidobacteriota bacterium]